MSARSNNRAGSLSHIILLSCPLADAIPLFFPIVLTQETSLYTVKIVPLSYSDATPSQWMIVELITLQSKVVFILLSQTKKNIATLQKLQKVQIF